MILSTEIIEFQDNLYVLKRKIKEEYNPNIEAWKEYLPADIVLRKEGFLYFLERIENAQIIEEGELIN